MSRVVAYFLIAIATPLSAVTANAQTEIERRNSDVVQDVYLRTLSTPPSTALVSDAQTAFDLAMRTYGATDGRTADMAVNLGRALNHTDQNQAAVPLLESALSIYADGGADNRLRAAVAQYELGVALHGAGNSEAAVEAYTQAFGVLEPTFRRLSAETGFVVDALRAAGGEEAVRAARAQAQGATSVSGAQPKPTLSIPPIYPPDESLASVDGWVLLDYRLWPDGSVRDVYVLAGSPDSVFDISAAMALLQWRFEPQANPAGHYQLNVAFQAP